MAEETAQSERTLQGLIDLTAEERLCAVVDACKDDGALTAQPRDEGKKDVRTLFQGPMAPRLGHVAPYVVPIDPESDYLEKWQWRWGTSAGILIVVPANVDMDALWAHLRAIFVAEDEAGTEYFFRYYDPRVLRVYLPTCTVEEAAELFGPIRRMIVESAEGDAALICSPGVDGALLDEHAFARAQPPAEESEPGEPAEGEEAADETA